MDEVVTQCTSNTVLDINQKKLEDATLLLNSYSRIFIMTYNNVLGQIISIVNDNKICKIKNDLIPKLLFICDASDYNKTVLFLKTINNSSFDQFSAITNFILYMTQLQNALIYENNKHFYIKLNNNNYLGYLGNQPIVDITTDSIIKIH